MTRIDARRFVVAYDVSQDRRRERVAKALSAYGDRVQYSVFVVDATPVKMQRLRRQVEKLIDKDADSVLICDLGLVNRMDDGRFTYLGRRRVVTDFESFIV